MAKHFDYCIVPGGEWIRFDVEGSSGLEPRPHFVALSDGAKLFVEYDALMGGQTGLCPGYVIRKEEKVPSYRFQTLAVEGVEAMLADLDREVDRFSRPDSN